MEMGKSSRSISVMLLLVAMLALSIGVDLKVEARKPPLDIETTLKALNKPAVKTIKVLYFQFLLRNDSACFLPSLFFSLLFNRHFHLFSMILLIVMPLSCSVVKLSFLYPRA